MPKSKLSSRSEKKPKSADLPKSDFDKEMILQAIPKPKTYNDEFEDDWCADRARAGSILKPLSDSSFKHHPSPLYLTKLGHGNYDKSSDVMTNFFFIKNPELISKFKLALEQSPSITRINLYSCRSASIPRTADNEPLIERVGMKLDDNDLRYQYGALSYAEYFILELRQAYLAEDEEFPSGLTVFACAGEVYPNSGKLGISGSKRPPLKESFNTVDGHSGLVQINCDAFLNSYDKALRSKREIEKSPVETTEGKGEMPQSVPRISTSRQSFFSNSKPSSSSSSSSSSSLSEQFWGSKSSSSSSSSSSSAPKSSSSSSSSSSVPKPSSSSSSSSSESPMKCR